MKTWFNGEWHLDPSMRQWMYLPAGEYEASASLPDDAYTIRVGAREMQQLIRALDEAGWIVPRVDERLRAEDLKITHRHLDIIEALAKKPPGLDKDTIYVS